MSASSSRPVVLGAGPVGRSVVERLVARGARPVVVTRSGTAVPGAEAVAGDVADPHQAAELLAGADVVFHAAQPAYTRWPQDFPSLQAGIVAGVVAAGATLVAVENLYGYAPSTEPYREDLPLAATTRKGAVRAALWRDLQARHEAGEIRAVAARASDFFGPGVAGSLVGDRFFGPIVRGKKADLLGDPNARHAYTYVPDLAEALVRLSEAPDTWGRAWHVPNAPAVTQRGFLDLAAAAAGVQPRFRAVKPWQLKLLGRFVPEVGEMVELAYEVEHDHLVDHSAYAARFGDHATPLEESVAATVRWYQAQER